MSDLFSKQDLDLARKVLRIETNAIVELSERLDESFLAAVSAILGLGNSKGKLIVTGMGKSGLIGRKIASTFASTGTPAIFVHPAETSHGDLGVISDNDVVLALSYGGESSELNSVLRFVNRKGIPLIAMTGKPESTLGRAAKVCLNISVKEEACPMGLAPTSSSTATLALGDALAMVVLDRKGFKTEDYAELHPGGSLGRKLLTRVSDIMHSGDALPLVTPETTFSDVVVAMASKEVRGVVGVVDKEGSLQGIVTEGDIRRRLQRNQGPLTETAAAIMSVQPKTIHKDELAEKALFVMEQFRIQTLFAVDANAENPKQPVGVLHIQDLLRANIR